MVYSFNPHSSPPSLEHTGRDCREILHWNIASSLATLDSSVTHLPGSQGRWPHPELAVWRGKGLPSSCLLPHQNTLPHPQDGTERETYICKILPDDHMMIT